MSTFEASFQSTSIPAVNGAFNILFTTGERDAVFVARGVGFSGVSAVATVYESPTGVSGGTTVDPHRLNQRVSTAPTGVMKKGVTISGLGTQVSSQTFYRGSSGVGHATVGTFSTQAGFRKLKANTTYLLQFVNTDPTNPQIVDFYFQWYEGRQ